MTLMQNSKIKIFSGLVGVMVFGLIGVFPAQAVDTTRPVINCIKAPCPGGDESQKDFSIISPAGGETIQTGQTIKIRWVSIAQSFAPQYVRISLPPSPSCLDQYPSCYIPALAPYVIVESTEDDGEYNWTIPTTLPDSYLGEVKIKIEILNQTLVSQSGRFIIATTKVSEPRVISPGPTDTWKVGQTYKIKWFIPGFIQYRSEIRLIPYNDRTSAGSLISSRGKNTGEYNWKVPTNLSSDYYINPVLIRIMVAGITAESAPFWLQANSEQPLKITTTLVPQGVADQFYSYQLEASGGMPSYRWTGSFGNSGLSVSSNGVLSGTPRIGVHRITVNVVDASNTTSSQLLQLSVVGQTTTAPHSAGSLVLNLDNIPTSVWLLEMENGVLKRRSFGSAEVFLSHGYKWSNIVPANSGDAALFLGAPMDIADGTLVRDGRSSRTFYVTYPNKVKRGFSSFDIFQSMGYQTSQALITSLAHFSNGSVITIFDSHAPGSDVIENGTIYRIMPNNTRIPYPSLAVYNTWHTNDGDFTRVYPANSFDRLIPISGVMVKR